MGNVTSCRPCSSRDAPPSRFPEELERGLAYDDGGNSVLPPLQTECTVMDDYGEYEELLAGHSSWHVETMLHTHRAAIDALREAVRHVLR